MVALIELLHEEHALVGITELVSGPVIAGPHFWRPPHGHGHAHGPGTGAPVIHLESKMSALEDTKQRMVT